MFGLPQLELPFFWTKPGAPVAPRTGAGGSDGATKKQTGTSPQSGSASGPKSGSQSGSSGQSLEEAHQISLGGQVLSYTVRRSARRRTLGLQIDARGLRVGAPIKARQGDIEQLIQTHARWVLTKLKQWQRPEHQTRRAWMPGDALPLLGTLRPLRIAPGRAGLAKFDDALILTVPQPDDEASLRTRLRDALKHEARTWFAPRLAHYAQTYGVATPALRLSQAKTRWGSCARDRDGTHRVSLNWRMIHFEAHLIDYVIAHEIAHTKHMHHGPRFWGAVAKLYPDYTAARDEIRKRAFELPEI